MGKVLLFLGVYIHLGLIIAVFSSFLKSILIFMNISAIIILIELRGLLLDDDVNQSARDIDHLGGRFAIDKFGNVLVL